MKIENPFAGMKDIAEKAEDPEFVFERYSTEPFRHVLSYLMEPSNCFVVGRT